VGAAIRQELAEREAIESPKFLYKERSPSMVRALLFLHPYIKTGLSPSINYFLNC
jgi:hypothetical protein